MKASGPAFLFVRRTSSGAAPLPFAEALEQVRRDLARYAEKDTLFAAHLEIADDPLLRETVEKYIFDGLTEQKAIEAACAQICQTFTEIDDEYLRARVDDVRDVFNRIGRAVAGETTANVDVPRGSILVAEELLPSDTVSLDFDHLAGIICHRGSTTSHVCILARSKGIPIAVGLPINAIRPGDIVEVEDPLVGTLPIAEKVRKAGRKLFANAGSVQDIRNAMKAGADGIGLFRTEFLFLGRPDIPSEEEQEAIYRNAIEACNGKPLTIRLLDAGGDKALPWYSPEQEDNPFLGVRGIRLLLANPEILHAQIRAILRAAADTRMTGETRIMIPMVTRIDEIRTVRDMVSSESALLEDVNGSIPVEIGAMIETPAAVLNAVELAAACDFFSAGTNDLTQYVMAADRGNAAVSYLYDALSPAMKKALEMTVDAARSAGIPVGICGELASDPRATELLLGLGFDSLSISLS